MRIFFGRLTCVITTASALGLASCRPATVDDSRFVHVGVRLSHTSAQASPAPKGPYVSIIDSVYLTIRRSSDTSVVRTLSSRLRQTDTVMVFEDVVLEQGDYVFDARVVSNKSITIFAKSQQFRINRDAYTVDLTLVPLTPVLLVTPDLIRVSPNPIDTATLEIHNRGESALAWSVSHNADPRTCGCAILFGAPNAAVMRGNVNALTFTPFSVTVRKPATLAIAITFSSKEGDVVVVAR